MATLSITDAQDILDLYRELAEQIRANLPEDDLDQYIWGSRSYCFLLEMAFVPLLMVAKRDIDDNDPAVRLWANRLCGDWIEMQARNLLSDRTLLN